MKYLIVFITLIVCTYLQIKSITIAHESIDRKILYSENRIRILEEKVNSQAAKLLKIEKKIIKTMQNDVAKN
jgi:hypothetical protein